ncbi:MAG: site-specific integrase [Verrucomicrobiota bacterium]
MPLELRKQRDGRLREDWYARYEVNGKRYTVNLAIKITGTPPASGSLLDEGDTKFQMSRAAAQMKLDSLVEEVRSNRSATHLVERMIEGKTNEAIKSVKLANLPDEWAKIARRRQVDDRYARQCRSTLKRFADHVAEQSPRTTEIAQVSRTLARGFMDAETKRRVTGKTWNDTLKLLRATFKHLSPPGGINPFFAMPTRETETVFRIPFTPEELAAISEAAKADAEIRPIIILGMCTAMRRGDCCLLEWKDVDLVNRFITVKTSKTGQTVMIPIFPMLLDELKTLAEKLKGKPDGFVFPDLAKTYTDKPDEITNRVKRVLASALVKFVSDEARPALLTVSTEEARKRGEEYIAAMPENEKRARMADVFKLYMEGKNIKAVMAGAKVSKGTASGHLNEIQAAIGCQIIRGVSHTGKSKAELAGLQVARQHGLRRASVRDFHSFRVTWVTLALTAGVPLELVQKVTGHKTTDIVLKHYFQPGREAFRSALNKAMPKLLTNGQKPEVGGQKSEGGGEKQNKKIRAILENSTAKTWKQDQARMLKLLAEGQKGKS